MYNAEQKQRFIDQQNVGDRTKNDIRRLFDRSEVYELSCGKDLCEMDSETLKPIISAVCGFSTSSKRVGMVHLRCYCKWCVDNHIPRAKSDAVNIYIQHLETDVDRVRDSMVSGPIEMDLWLDSVFLPESENTVDNVYRAYYWAAFSGVPHYAIEQMDATNIDFDAMAFIVDGKAYPFMSQATPSLRNICELKQFRYVHPLYAPSTRDRFPSDKIFRTMKNDASNISLQNNIRQKITSAKKVGERIKNISYLNARKSGVFYNYYESERARYILPFKDYIMEIWNNDNPTRSRSAIYTFIKCMQQDYEAWKLAFRVE